MCRRASGCRQCLIATALHSLACAQPRRFPFFQHTAAEAHHLPAAAMQSSAPPPPPPPEQQHITQQRSHTSQQTGPPHRAVGHSTSHPSWRCIMINTSRRCACPITRRFTALDGPCRTRSMHIYAPAALAALQRNKDDTSIQRAEGTGCSRGQRRAVAAHPTPRVPLGGGGAAMCHMRPLGRARCLVRTWAAPPPHVP